VATVATQRAFIDIRALEPQFSIGGVACAHVVAIDVATTQLTAIVVAEVR